MKTKILIKTSKALTFFIVLSAIAALAAAASELVYESSGTSAFKLLRNPDGSRIIEKISQDYMTYFNYTQAGGEEIILVSSNKKIISNLEVESIGGTISWSVRKGPKLEQVLWSKTEDSTSLTLNGGKPVLVSGQAGCCAEMDGFRMYDLQSGKLFDVIQ